MIRTSSASSAARITRLRAVRNGAQRGRPDALAVVDEPTEIPGGFQAVYQEPGGAIIYVIDQSTDATAQ